MLAPYINAIVQHLSQNYSRGIYLIILHGGEVCFLAATEKWILFSKAVFYSISSYWGIKIINIVINKPCLLIPVILLLL